MPLLLMNLPKYCHSMYIEILYDYDTVFSKTSLILDYRYRASLLIIHDILTSLSAEITKHLLPSS